MSVMEYLGLGGFAIYLILHIDSLLTQPLLGLYSYYSYFYIVLLILIIIYRDVLRGVESGHARYLMAKANPARNIIFTLTAYYCFFAITTKFSPMKEYLNDEFFAIVKFLIVFILLVHLLGRKNHYKSFILTSFYTLSGIIFFLFLRAGAPLNGLSNISILMSQYGRNRMDFGYYNVNGIGNLAATAIMLGCLCFGIQRGQSQRFIKNTLLIVLEIINVVVLISSASRNSIFTVATFLIVLLFLYITSSRRLGNAARHFLQIVVIAIFILLFLMTKINVIQELFVTSYRSEVYARNMKLLLSSNRLLIGLGVFSTGLFGQHKVAYGPSFQMDSYYMYVLVETGVIGLFIIIGIFIYMGKRLFQKYNQERGAFLLIALFFAWLASGLAETCVIYPRFPSSLILLSLFTMMIYESPLSVFSSLGEMNR